MSDDSSTPHRTSELLARLGTMWQEAGIAARLTILIVTFCLICSAILVLASGFNSDDFMQLCDLKDSIGVSVRQYLTGSDTYSPHFFRPGARSLHRVLGAFFHQNPMPYHVVSLVIHGIICILAFRLLVSLKVPYRTAFWFALVFAIHPIHVEPIASIASLGGLSVVACYLAGLCAWLRFLRVGRIAWGGLALLCVLLGLTLKEEAVTMPLAYGVLWWFRGRRNRRQLWPVLLSIPVVAAWCLWRVSAGVGMADSPAMFSANPLTWGRNVLFYAVQIIVPVRSVLRIWDYEIYNRLRELLPPTPDTPAYVVAVVIGVGALGVIAVRQWRRWPYSVKMGLIFAAIAMIPFYVYPQSGNRLLYLPSLGFILALTGLMLEHRSSRLKAALFYGWITIMSVAMVEQASTWRTAGEIAAVVLKDAVRVRRSVPSGQASVFRDVPTRHYGAYILSSGFREGVMLRTDHQYEEIYNFDRPGFDSRPIPVDARWFRWLDGRFVEESPPPS